MKLDDEEPQGDRVKEKRLKREGEVSDREEAKCVWESFGAEVHCGRADSVSGGSEVWINASDWREAAAVVREQNIRQGEKREREEERWKGYRHRILVRGNTKNKPQRLLERKYQ